MITVQSLSELDATTVDEQAALLAAMVQEYAPDVRVANGFFRDIVIRLGSMFAAANQKNLSLLGQAASLGELAAHPELADPDLVAAAAANYRLTRGAGATATGSVALVVTASPFVVPAGTAFTAATGKVYRVRDRYVGYASAATVTGATDVLMTARSDGKYELIVPVAAAAAGAVYNLAAPAALTTALAGTSEVRLATNVVGGADQESITSLIGRMQSGVAHRSLSSAAAIEAVIRTAVPSLRALSVAGYGDPEQLRYHALFPLAYGGPVDVYVRTTDVPTTVTLTKTCVYAGTDANGYTLWQAALGRDDAPGFYEPLSADRPGRSDGFLIVLDTRTADATASVLDATASGLLRPPDVRTALEAAYTRYQTAVLRVRDTQTSPAGLTVNVSTASYRITLRCQPHLAAAQDAVADRAVASPAGDCLIRAAIPCTVGVAVTLAAPASAALDSAAVRGAVAAAINATGFGNTLSAFVVSGAVQAELAAQGSTAVVTSVYLTGRLRKPDGAIVNSSGSLQLTMPEDPVKMVTSRTICFFCATGDVAVTVTPA